MFFNGGRGDASSCFLFLLPVWKADDIAGAPGAILNHEVIEASTEDLKIAEPGLRMAQ